MTDPNPKPDPHAPTAVAAPAHGCVTTTLLSPTMRDIVAPTTTKSLKMAAAAKALRGE